MADTDADLFLFRSDAHFSGVGVPGNKSSSLGRGVEGPAVAVRDVFN
jgi:hypothetical protein